MLAYSLNQTKNTALVIQYFLCTLILIILTIVSLSARADGGFVSHAGEDLKEPNQLALIVWEGEIEDLYLMVDFVESGGQELDRFGWILALPMAPEVEEADKELFVELMDMTNPYQSGGNSFDLNCFGMAGAGDAASDTGGLEIEGTTIAGAYEITTVSSDSLKPLRNWIENQGFDLDIEADPILQWYIDKDWRFLAVNIDLDGALDNGMLKPLKLSFETETPVFPLKISAINGIGNYQDEDYGNEYDTEVLIYIISDKGMYATNRPHDVEFRASYEADELDQFPLLRDVLPSSGVITKLRFTVAPEYMDDDVFFSAIPSSAGFAATSFTPSSRYLLAYAFLVLIVAMSIRLYINKGPR